MTRPNHRDLKWTHAHLALDEFGNHSDEVRLRHLGPEAFSVVFQPIVRLDTGRSFGEEALVRPRLEPFPTPDTLFEAAVRQQACGWIGRAIREITLESARDVTLFINIHPHELHARWLSRPDDPIGTHTQDIYLEITEVAALEHLDISIRVLTELRRRLGIKIAVDDLGSGFADLRRVLTLKPDVVKFDRCLASGIDRDPNKLSAMREMRKICEDLGALVVAEGIETAGELAAVIECGVPLGQGYLLARPAYPAPPIHWPVTESSTKAPTRQGRYHIDIHASADDLR